MKQVRCLIYADVEDGEIWECNERQSEVGQKNAFDCWEINARYKGKQEFGDTKRRAKREWGGLKKSNEKFAIQSIDPSGC